MEETLTSGKYVSLFLISILYIYIYVYVLTLRIITKRVHQLSVFALFLYKKHGLARNLFNFMYILYIKLNKLRADPCFL